MGSNQYVGGLISGANQNGVIENAETLANSLNSVLTVDTTGSNSYSFVGFMRDKSTTGTGTLALVKNGTGTQVLGGTQISYTGPTTINAGKLSLNGAAIFASAIGFGAGSTGTLEIQTAAQPITGLSTADSVTTTDIVQNVAATSGVITDTQTANTTFGGVLQNNPVQTTASTLGLTKAGTGSLTLSGANTFSGVLNVTAGTLQLQANAGNTAGGVSSVAGAAYSGTTTRFNLAGGSTLQLRSDSNVTFQGVDAIGGLNNATVTIDVNQVTAAGSNNVMSISTAAATPIGNAVTVNVTGGNGDSLSFGTIDSVTGGATNLTLNPTTASMTLGTSGTGATATPQTGSYFNYNNAANSSTLTLSGTSTGNVVAGVISNQGTINGVASTGTTGVVAVTKTGTSTWTLNAASTYTGATTVNGGTLALSSTASLGNTAITVTNAGTIFAPQPGAGTVSAGTTGAGALAPPSIWVLIPSSVWWMATSALSTSTRTRPLPRPRSL